VSNASKTRRIAGRANLQEKHDNTLRIFDAISADGTAYALDVEIATNIRKYVLQQAILLI